MRNYTPDFIYICIITILFMVTLQIDERKTFLSDRYDERGVYVESLLLEMRDLRKENNNMISFLKGWGEAETRKKLNKEIILKDTSRLEQYIEESANRLYK